MPGASWLVGYGTLLYRGSLGQTIGSDTVRRKEIVPVTVRNHLRLFNLRPDHYESSFKLHRRPIERGAMNVEPAEGVAFNALAFQATPDELGRLDVREHYYCRRTVPLFRFGNGELLGEGHLYMSEPDARWIERDPRRLMPLWRDIVWARAGAYAVGEAFGRRFDATTFLADGRTRVVDAYHGVLDDTGDVAMPG